MPLYEYYENAANYVKLKDEGKKQAVIGSDAVIKEILNTNKYTFAFDGWYGVDFANISKLADSVLKASGASYELIDFSSYYKSEEEINSYRKKYITDDPSFGWVNDEGTIADIIDSVKLSELKIRLTENKKAKKVTVVYGFGAAVNELCELYERTCYFDFTMQPMLWQMWDGKLIPFGRTMPHKDYNWKSYYYNDFYLLYRHKKNVFKRMDFFIDAVHSHKLKMLPAAIYNEMIDETVKQPIKQVKILQPGPWGAYRYKDLWKVEGLECNAWNELAGIELSVLIDIGAEDTFNVPSQNIMQRPVQLVGEYVNKTYPDLLPLQVWLDDGYFADEQPLERVSMPIHDHPSTNYVKKHFNEPLGRYETYYIVESYKNSGTMMGYKESANLEEWEQLCRESENMKVIPNWQDYIKRWDTTVGDLFHIPPGTSHGHGGNQMILEMDTGPSVAGTEYSFFTYDFARNTWDDKNKTMTAKPMRMHLEHSFKNNKFVRETRAKEFHRARPVTVEGNGKYRKDRYTTLPEQPFHIERIFLEEQAQNDTEGKYMHIATLTEGKRVTVRSLENNSYSTTIERLQSCIIPAGLGKHEYINEDGSHAMVVIIRLKKG